MIARWLPGAAALLMATAALAQPVDGLQHDDAVVAAIAWRLQTGNAALCPRRAMASGAQIADAADYVDPGAARAVYGLGGDLFVGAVADGSPAALAGVTVNTTLARIGQVDLATLAPPRAPFERARQAQALLDSPVTGPEPVVLAASDGRQWRLSGVPVCRVRVMVDDGGNHAVALRDEIHISRRGLADAHDEEAAIAGMIAHELAHAVLDHEAELRASRRAFAVVRRTEREADRLSVWLLANAGYAPEAALAFQRVVVAHRLGFLTIDPTHGGWHERSRVIAAEIAVLNAAPDHDWQARFKREPD